MSGVRTSHGFLFGPADVSCLTHIEGRGYVIGVETGRRAIHVYVSEAGRSVRVFTPGIGEWSEPTGDPIERAA